MPTDFSKIIIDLAKASIQRNIDDAFSDDLRESAQACRVLGVVGAHDRLDAIVFLLGLLSYHRDDLKRLESIVEALGDCRLPIVAEALFGEIDRVRSSNQTRTYLNVVIKTLARFPKEMVADRFVRMSEDTALSPKMRSKFRGIAAGFDPSLRDDNFGEW